MAINDKIQGKSILFNDNTYCVLGLNVESMQSKGPKIKYQQPFEKAIETIILDSEVRTLRVRSNRVARVLKLSGEIDMNDRANMIYQREIKTDNQRKIRKYNLK
jgi:hypothetical protein